MGTTREDIEEWCKEGKREKATHMIVVCDTFDHEDYPVYVYDKQDIRKTIDEYNGKNMQRIMEVYNLTKPLKPQLDAKRAYEID